MEDQPANSSTARTPIRGRPFPVRSVADHRHPIYPPRLPHQIPFTPDSLPHDYQQSVDQWRQFADTSRRRPQSPSVRQETNTSHPNVTDGNNENTNENQITMISQPVPSIRQNNDSKNSAQTEAAQGDWQENWYHNNAQPSAQTQAGQGGWQSNNTQSPAPDPMHTEATVIQAYSSGRQLTISVPTKKDFTQKGYKPKVPRNKPNQAEGRVEAMSSDTQVDSTDDVFRQTGDTVQIEDRFSNMAVPSDVSYPCIIANEAGQSLFENGRCMITYLCSPYVSHVLITLASSDKKEKSVAQYRGILRLPATAIRTLDIQTDKTMNQEWAAAGPNNAAIKHRIEYSVDQICSENILCKTAPESVNTSKLVNHLRSEKPLMIHVQGHERTITAFNALNSKLANDASVVPYERWIAEGKTSFVIQKNEFIRPEHRPAIFEHPLPRQYSYFCYEDFLVRNAIADLQSVELTTNKLSAYETNRHTLYTADIINGGDRVKLGLLDIPVEEQIRLNPGDILQFRDPETEDANTALRAQVTSPLPNLPASLITLHIWCKWDKEERRWHSGPFNFKSIPLDSQDSIVTNIEKLRKQGSTEVIVHIDQDTESYKNRVVGLANLHQHLHQSALSDHGKQMQMIRDLKQSIIGNDIGQINEYDIFEPVLGVAPDPRKLMRKFNPGQEAAYNLCRQAPAGWVNIQGCPGSGKTFLAKEFARPFILAKSQILCISPTNQVVNEFTNALQATLLEMNPDHTFLIRLHCKSSELEIAKQQARLRRGIPEDAKPQVIQRLTDQDTELLESMQFARLVYEDYMNAHTYDNELVHDHRVTSESIKYSEGVRILQMMGKMPSGKGDPKPHSDRFHDLCILYDRFESGGEMSKEDSNKLDAELKSARQIVLAEATIIVTTPALAVQPTIVRACQNSVSLLIIDESAKLNEIDVITLLGNYPQAYGKVCVGDPFQLRPYTELDQHNSHFHETHGTSMMERQMGNGMPYAFLNIQHRMSPDISKPLGEFAYQGRLIDHPSVNKEHRPILLQIEDFFKQKYGKSKYCLMHDVTDTVTEEVPHTGSRYNLKLAQHSVSVAMDLMDRFPNQSTSLITFYNAQHRLMLNAKTKMVAEKREYSKLKVLKADAAQGFECDFVIVDFPIRGHGGFLNEKNRLVVALSRSRIALIIVIDKAAMDKVKSRTLNGFMSKYLASTPRVVIKEVSNKYLDQSMVNWGMNTNDAMPDTQGWNNEQGEWDADTSDVEMLNNQDPDSQQGEWGVDTSNVEMLNDQDPDSQQGEWGADTGDVAIPHY